MEGWGRYDQKFHEWINNKPLVEPCGLWLSQDSDNIDKAPIGTLVSASNGELYIVVNAGDLRRWHQSSL